ncbi:MULTISPECIES: prepilin-type N-terminal cleavage/methylation domain-containing protein [unclassified Microcystis]|jgi:prepilin-type N-terminal cleavage/methylation domain-containing protein|uniref:prepilin-type N-terminal cleavage/methylation domain-containing protein n=1 Tax=unclassified Microcystis TaxID=2643300 RepID=UPI002585CDF5|nr:MULTISPECIES: prepilin-type N-terminal cleavage/methylation domain-containing protein [unclassified Microcystis]MCA2761541.1 prepilin-type N-terminal cleavage/methylation domain-containing protein [Microcystis sp. M151S2]MCA2642264.1 prepilin-type N-terminal cleavage/methylation domain-containing protein [Microcystis sp. M087S2]MCA2673306.1 prepilin-type N-terminal cleavage/methylation domain-containing protein [Microcystis sp. M080S2]MCA2686943.1 prepilin-type N-terminal cleavage/methylatio
MRRLNVHHKNQGFTLLEILVALAITGILAALTLPNLLAWLNSNRVQQATDSIQSALQDAQKQAMRRGRICTINFTNGTGTNPTVYSQITASEAGCLVATNTNAGSLRLPQEVFMVVNNFPTLGGNPGVQFSFRGHVPGLTFTPPQNQAIIVLYPAAANTPRAPYPNQERKCLVMASLLGIVKQGTYNGNPLVTLDARQCQIRLDGTQP